MSSLKAIQFEIEKISHEGVILDGVDMWTKQGAQWIHHRTDKPYTLKQIAIFVKNKRACMKEGKSKATKMEISWELWRNLNIDGTISCTSYNKAKFWCFTGYSNWYLDSVKTEDARNSTSYSQSQLVDYIYNNQ